MNLFERLMYRRLCSEAPPEGGDGGAAPAATGDNPAAADNAANPNPGEGDNPEGEGKQEGSKTAEELAAEKEAKEKADKEAAEKAEKEKKPAAPEKYEFTAPEGLELDANALAVFEPIAKELGLSQEQAQKLVDIYPQIQQQQAEAWSKQVADWGEQVKADKEIGGDKFNASVGAAQRALDQFGNTELREYLNASGLGNHPALVRFCAKVGKAMAEDTFVVPNQGGQRSAADILYGKKE
ncbi:peptidase [Serratia sp. IR-2025]|uniref:peptidase n=1 Tax=Serratia marcescens TaxID=615 RepID=UPI0006695ACF|nr:peptidase [Serratia marcescens]MBN5324011.1 peptidase [Serratia marcescens]MBN5347008.1 peptidase [Serratia marcescens]MDU0859321.1 peptidase [Serratia marcescens]POX19363.1 peptidase [Serratia marcescens]HAX9713560.1 peptidase [Serratia marcescens]